MKILKISSKILLIFLVIFSLFLMIGISYAEEDNLISSNHGNDSGINSFDDYNFNNLNKSDINNSNSYHNVNSSNKDDSDSSDVNKLMAFNKNNVVSSRNFNSIASNGIGVFADGDEIYVSTSGNDGNDGYTQETAKQTIANALAAVNNGGTIYIMGGTYTGTGNIGLSINKNVTIIGNTTIQDVILDGQNINQRVITVGNNVNLQIQNIIFTNARVIGNGAVIYASSVTAFNVNITLNNCSFTNNYATAEGGAIYLYSGTTASRTNLTILNCTFNSNTANSLYGGAISAYFGNLIYIENSNFNNNTATISGAIETNQINTTMINSNFTGNKATTLFGGVMNHDIGANTITVTNCIFTNNSCVIDGGVFRIAAVARLNVNNSVFINNFAGNDLGAEGGAIYSQEGRITVINSNFTGNGAYLRGGAIGSFSSLAGTGLFVYGCNFVNNYVIQTLDVPSSNTILIWSNHPVEINYNRFYNNTGSPNNYVIFVHDALSNASISYNWWGDNQLPIANTLALNTISNYFVVDVVLDSISDGVARFNYTIRLNNSGNFDPNGLPEFFGNFSTIPNIISGSFIADRSGSLNIPFNGNITFNFRVDNWNKSINIFALTGSTLILDPISDTVYGSNINITGRLLDENGNPIVGVPVNLTINGFIYTVITGANGTFSLGYTVNDTGVIDVIGEFYGTDDFLATSNITSFNVIPTNTSIIIDPIPDTKVGQTVIINGTLVDSNGNPLSNLPVNVLINGVLYSVTTNENGRFNVSYIVNTTGIIAVLAQFQGNERYNASANTSSFNGVLINTTIVIDDIDNTQVGNTIIITGRLLDENNQPIANADLTITINGFDYFVQTNSSGGFNLSYIVNRTGINTVIVHYEGNETYSQSSNSTTFSASRINTIIVVDNINDTRIGDSVNITGILVDEFGQPVVNDNVTIFVDGFSYDVTTDSSGRFILLYLVNRTGNISVLFQYDGNNIYNPSSNSTYFMSSRIDTVIIADNIPDTRIGNSVNITGTLVDEDGNPIANGDIIIIINGVDTVVTTNSTGGFSLEYTVTESGIITVLYEYPDTIIYNPSSNSTTFNGIKINTTIIVDNVPDTPVGNSVNITGTLVDEDGQVITNAIVMIIVNGTSYNVTTNSTGGFSLNYAVISSGAIGINYIYEGNDTYEASTNFTSFNGFAINTSIILDSINDTKIGNNVTISGRLVDENGNGLADADVTVIINGFNEIVRTNSTGGFSLNYTVTRSGIISVIFVYNGNITYNPSSNSTNFQGLKLNTTIIVDIINNTKIGDNVNISGTLVDENNNPVANANITIFIDGVVRNVITDSSGRFILNYTVDRSGIICVLYEYDGNEIYNPSSNQTSFEALKLGTQIIIDNINDTIIGNTIIISGNLIDENSQPIANANLTITINGFDYIVQTNSSGGFNLSYTVNTSGNITVFIYYEGNETYSQSSNNTTFSASRINTIILVDNINDTRFGDSVDITGTLVDEFGQIIANATVSIFVNGLSYDVITDSFGRFILNYIVDRSGIISVFYEYDGNETYNPSSNQTSFEALKLSTQIIIDNINDTKIGNNVTISGRLIDENGQAIANAQVNVYINGNIISVLTDSNGIFSFNYTVDRNGEFYITVTYLGNDIFEQSYNETSFIGLRLNTSIIFDPIRDTRINDTAVISGTLVDEYNRPVANARINIFVNGFLYVDLTDSNGRFSFNYPVTNPIIINVLGTFPGTDFFAPSTNRTYFNGLGFGTNIIFDPIGNVAMNDTIMINGTLIDENNNPVSNVNITLTINGTDYVVLTDSNGRFSISYFVGNEPRVFIVNAVFAGNLEYNYSYNSTSFTVNKISTNLTIPDISGIVGDEVNITATLTDNNGNRLVGKNIIFYIEIDGSYVYIGTATTDANGVATIQYNISRIGSYNIHGVFAGDDIYAGSNATGLAIFSIRTNIIVENATGSVGDTVDLIARLTDSYGNPIADKIIDFYADGTYIGSSLTNTEGIAIHSYLITRAGTHIIRAVFNGDDYFAPSAGIRFGVFTVGRSNLEVYDITGSVGDTVDLFARLTDSYGNPIADKVIDFYVDGIYIGSSLTNTEGVAIHSYLITSVGNHTIRAVFNGDSYLSPSEGMGMGIFTAGESNLEVYAITGKVGDTVYLTTKLTDKNGEPLYNKTIDFYIDGEYIGSTITNMDGIARLPYLISKERFTLTVIFEGDSNYLASENSYTYIESNGNKSNVTSNGTSSSIILPKSSIGMKKTGLPLIAILVLIIGLGLVTRKKY